MIERVDEITAQLLIKPVLAGICLSVLFAFALSLRGPKALFSKRFFTNIFRSVSYALPLVLIGYVSGYVTGISRVSAVGNLIPAMLTLVGALTIYLFQFKTRQTIIAVGYSVFMLALSVFYGIQVGAYQREYEQVTRFKVLSDEEREIRNYRLNHELPADPPDWITGATKQSP